VSAASSRLVLDGRIGWRVGVLEQIEAADAIRLRSHPTKPRPLNEPSGTLAGFVGPIWAVATGPLGYFLIDRAGTHVLVYDPCLEQFARLPCLGGVGDASGQLRGARALAICRRGRLYVADTGNRRIQVIDLALGRVVQIIGPRALTPEGAAVTVLPSKVMDPATGLPTGEVAWPPGTWQPSALLALPDGEMLVADQANAVLFAVDPRGRVTTFPDGAAPDGSHIAAPVALGRDRDGRIYVVQQGLPAVRVLEPDGAFAEDVALPDDLAGRFDAPAVSVDPDGVVWISDRIAGPTFRLCRDAAGRCLPPEPVRPMPANCPLLAFDQDGVALLGSTQRPCLMRAPERAFADDGLALSQALDSALPACLWDRIKLWADVPMGARLFVATFTADTLWDLADVAGLPDDRWRSAEIGAPDADGTWDVSVLSDPGRYLWLRLTMTGDTHVTPAITRIEANWPRITSRRFLPAALAPDAVSADFLDRFMTAFDRVRAGYTRHLDDIAGYFDPLATPAAEQGAYGPDFLDWLAAWIGVALQRNWPVSVRRQLVKQAPALFRIRGTPEGLKRHVALYTGIEPKLIEHYRLRRWLALDSGQLGADSALWGPEIMARLQLDAFSQIGDFVLVDTGDPLVDPFNATAHRATLLAPAEDPSDSKLLAELGVIVALAAPAHVLVDIRLLAAGFSLGCSAVLGSATQLPCRPPPVQLDGSVLGDRATLGGRVTFRLPPRGGARLGADTRLTS
jgi:phage tail-like protein